MSLLRRFEAKYSPEPNTGCWLWTGAVMAKGYGQIKADGTHSPVLYAHRAAYELFKGPIPPGLQIDHLCRQRSCVNPRHLEAVTQQVNIRRGNAGKYVRRTKR